MQDQQDVASLYAKKSSRGDLWKAAIKWPMYSVAVMPALLAAGWRVGAGEGVRLDQLFGFLVAAVLLLLWENLSNDLFDADTGVDSFTKLHSVVALLGQRRPVRRFAYLALALGLLMVLLLALRSSSAVLLLVLISCGLGYLYQGPPFRWGYLGLGEPLCWLAFGPFATAAALLVLAPVNGDGPGIPWATALALGSGPAIATTLVLFCSHFHQVAEDAAHGKRSPVVRLGTARAAALVPWFLSLTLALEWTPVLQGHWPPTALLGCLGLPAGATLIRLLRNHHDQPERIRGSKFLALRFQALNGLGLSLGLALAPSLGLAVSAPG
ncbi:MAG: 2-carboxy-1,4-naphthoquinone phytyltransferase [Prochlorococcus sp.]|jgi:1,4-dihydroxy-2-naphthoate octaprenyltransferase|nr:2-carboxy-1,4-naphthoquinone phytyltransferase [Prochlorococcaceae cyanobacterium ETNP2_MAG_10]MDP6197061.1 2-carboxy-1,4-naphthoquinone phytyltransferase [Prochlorococcaceae cyanobacterium ETNP18_MAG_17]MDP6321783.1 2-carboxy-1,4-naphthoquinone phytyltransferase [Prochlorococcaceae cyanobacterium ETNP14_MAG_5]